LAARRDANQRRTQKAALTFQKNWRRVREVKKFVDLKQKIAIMQKLARSVLAKKTVQTAKQERLALAVQGGLVAL
jgi:hypothetical protein